MENNQLEEFKFKIVNDEGKEVECEALFTFESDETHKHYIVYTDNTQDVNGNTKVYASVYTPGEEKSKLLPIESEEEWNKIQKVLDVIQEQAKEMMNKNSDPESSSEQA